MATSWDIDPSAPLLFCSVDKSVHLVTNGAAVPIN